MVRAGTNDPMTPEIRDPSRIKGTPSNTNARNENQKFCQLNTNHLISRKSSISLFGQIDLRGGVIVG